MAAPRVPLLWRQSLRFFRRDFAHFLPLVLTRGLCPLSAGSLFLLAFALSEILPVRSPDSRLTGHLFFSS
jgi:hypothetical protein